MKVFPVEDSGYGASGCNYTERRGGKTEEVSVFTESLVALVNCGGYRDLGRGGGRRVHWVVVEGRGSNLMIGAKIALGNAIHDS